MAVAGATALAFFATTAAARAEGGEATHPGFEGLERADTASATFDRNRYEIIHVTATSVGTFWNSTTEWWRPVRGTYRYPTKYADFYRALGRPDLAAQAESRHAAAETLFWSGVALMVGGLLGGSYELYKERKVGAIIGASAFVGGFVALRIGSALSRPTVEEPAAEAMADQYNRALGQHLGLTVGRDF
ncbi:MAG TPA: hypothetical protein VHU40_05740 [Polyangia bacterium]|nr:hypothetical protein [Polyangia bacterium]